MSIDHHVLVVHLISGRELWSDLPQFFPHHSIWIPFVLLLPTYWDHVCIHDTVMLCNGYDRTVAVMPNDAHIDLHSRFGRLVVFMNQPSQEIRFLGTD